MRLNPHPKPVRIRLSIDQQNGSGKIVYFGLDDLLKNFDFESLVPHIVDQSLTRWLEQLRLEDISKQIKQILEEKLVDKDETKSEENVNLSHISEQVIEQNKYRIICLLFDGIIKDEINSDKDFLSALIKLSSEYKGTIKNVLDLPAFSEYSAYGFLNNLIQGSDTTLGKLVEKHLDFLQHIEEERLKEVEKQKRKNKISLEVEKIAEKYMAFYNYQHPNYRAIRSPWEDSVHSVNCTINQRIRQGQKVITLRRTDRYAPCNGKVCWIGVSPMDEVTKGTLLALIAVEYE